MLVVISIIAVLAGLLFVVTPAAQRQAKLSEARAQLSQLQAAIEAYHGKYGFYPPDNTSSSELNPLYYELTGTYKQSANANNVTYRTPIGTNSPIIPAVFNLGGFVNSAVPGETPINFLNANPRFATVTRQGNAVRLLQVKANWPAPAPVTMPPPFPSDDPRLNVWRYNSSNPTNAPGTYMLWTYVIIGANANAKVDVVCNWKQQ